MTTFTSLKLCVAADLTAVFASWVAAAPVRNGGWAADALQSVKTISDESPYDFVLNADAFFRITHIGIGGDSFFV